jgi:cation:H+ antiporter
MVTALTEFSISVAVIVVAGIVLTRCADAVAERTGLGRLLVGSVLLAAATSLPELTIDLNAIWLGLPDLACGDLIGSSLFNLLILAIADLAHRSRGALMSRVAAAHSLSGAVTIALTSIVGIGILFERQLDGITLFGLGPATIGVFLAYAFGIRLIFFDQRASVENEPKSTHLAPTALTLRAAIAGYLLAATAILLAAPFLASAAGRIAEVTGLGGTFIGTTLVALVTSLPELVATLAAVRMGAHDLAIGNIFGSNAFNMLLLFPLDLAFPGALLASVSTTHALTCFAVILITAIVILGQLYRVERRTLFIEPDAGLVITLVLGALWMVYLAR